MRSTPATLLSAAALAAACAAPAHAAPSPGGDAGAVAREAAAQLAAARDAVPRSGPSDAPRASTAAKRKTVPSVLRSLQQRGAVEPAAAREYRRTWSDAEKLRRRLSGTRRRELGAVLANFNAMAAAGTLTASRLPAVFETVARNRWYWANAPLPPAGARPSIQGSPLVWQYYPGQGVQIQWLATFGHANALSTTKTRSKLQQLGALLDESLRLAAGRAGGIAFEYLFVFGGGRPPWVSGLAQGTGLSALARAAQRLERPDFVEAGRKALGIFRTKPPTGVRVRTDAGAHYLQYSYAPKLRIANGFVQAINGLYDFASLTGDAEARELFADGEAQLRSELPGYDTGAWSLYARPGSESNLNYHKVLRDFLQGLCKRLTDERKAAQPAAQAGGVVARAAEAPSSTPDPEPYCSTAQRFTSDLKTPPKITIQSRTLRARKADSIRFKLSKISTVTVTVQRNGQVVFARTLTLGYGTRSLGFRPARPGAHVVTVRATDLAGNTSSATGTIEVRRAPKRD